MFKVYKVIRNNKTPLVRAAHKGQEEVAEFYTLKDAQSAAQKMKNSKFNIVVEYENTFEETVKTDYFD